MSDILGKIKEYKIREVAKRKAELPLSALEAKALEADPPRGFRCALTSKKGLALIAEIKKASPSKGLIRSDFEPAQLARAYAAGDAACLSVLTDEPSFQGADPYLIQAREACDLPVLRKDFICDEYQVFEARVLGADCILLIMDFIDDHQARTFETIAMELGMDVLIETHNETEVERALKLQSPLIGINNRNLRTFKTSLDTTRRLAPLIGEEKEIVCESGLFTHQDLAQMAEIGVHRFLVGESLMRKADVKQATLEILGAQ